MFLMINNLQAAMIEQFSSSKENNFKEYKIAARRFERFHAKAKFSQKLSIILGRKNNLPALSYQPNAKRPKPVIKVVSLDKIVGSESRVNDFDSDFRPLKENIRDRWINIAIAYRNGIVLPAVELLQDGDKFFVRDGHHRVSVAKAMGQQEIDAWVLN